MRFILPLILGVLMSVHAACPVVIDGSTWTDTDNHGELGLYISPQSAGPEILELVDCLIDNEAGWRAFAADQAAQCLRFDQALPSYLRAEFPLPTDEPWRSRYDAALAAWWAVENKSADDLRLWGFLIAGGR